MTVKTINKILKDNPSKLAMTAIITIITSVLVTTISLGLTVINQAKFDQIKECQSDISNIKDVTIKEMEARDDRQDAQIIINTKDVQYIKDGVDDIKEQLSDFIKEYRHSSKITQALKN